MEITVELTTKNQRWVLNKPEIKMGREAQCDVRLSGEEFAMVSRLHASIRVQDGNCFVEDNNTANGTFLNGKRVQRAKLFPADKVRLGNDGPELAIKFVPEAESSSIPATIAGAPRPSKEPAVLMPIPAPALAKAEDSGTNSNATYIMLEQKLNGMQKLLMAALAVVILEGIIVIYQGYAISQTHDAVNQLRRQATDAVSQFVPTLDQKMSDFQKRADDMQTVVAGFDKKIKQAEDEFVARMQKEMPATMDRYIEGKLDELKGGGRRGR